MRILNLYAGIGGNRKLREVQIAGLEKLHDVDLSAYKLPNKRQVLRNCVHRDTGLALLLAAELEYKKRGAE